MRNRLKHLVLAGLVGILLVTGVALPAANAIGLGDVVKVGGIGFLIDRFSGPLNDFINTLLLRNKAEVGYATKVVPILSFGKGGYIGAAQVMGPADLVEQTQACIQIESDFNSTFRVKALVPIDSKNPVNFTRVNGVGLSAVIDIKI